MKFKKTSQKYLRLLFIGLVIWVAAACTSKEADKPQPKTGYKTESANSVGSDHWNGNFIPVLNPNEGLNMPVIPNYGMNGGNVPLDQLHVLTRYIGDLFVQQQTITTENSAAFTKNGLTTMVINTKDLENRGLYSAIRGGGPHIWISENFSSGVFPWAQANQELSLQMTASMPTVDLTDPQGLTGHSGFSANQAPVTQLSFGFYLKDTSSGKTLAYILPVYESRGTYDESIGNDTYVNFASSPVEDGKRFVTKSPFSDSLHSAPFSKESFFRVHITAENLLNAIRESNSGMSEDLRKYQLVQAGVLFELPNYVKDGHNTSMATVSDFGIYLYRFSNTPMPTPGTCVNGGTNPPTCDTCAMGKVLNGNQCVVAMTLIQSDEVIGCSKYKNAFCGGPDKYSWRSLGTGLCSDGSGQDELWAILCK